MVKKRPEITDGDERGRESCKTVGIVFSQRPWVIDVWETEQYKADDAAGIDMFVQATTGFLKCMNLGGVLRIIPVQIKSADGGVTTFIRHYAVARRFFNVEEKSHQFVLCGMDEPEYVLADIVGQLVVHAAGFQISQKEVLDMLGNFEDGEAVTAFNANKGLLQTSWYGQLIS